MRCLIKSFFALFCLTFLSHLILNAAINPKTENYYSNARYYDPKLGRFLRADPLKDGLNSYAYVHNNPLKLIDPTGYTAENPKHHPLDGLPGKDGADIRTTFNYQRPIHKRPVSTQIYPKIAFEADGSGAKLSNIIVPDNGGIKNAGLKVRDYLNELIGDRARIKFVAFHSGPHQASVREVSGTTTDKNKIFGNDFRTTSFWQLGFIANPNATSSNVESIPSSATERMTQILEDTFNATTAATDPDHAPIVINLVKASSESALAKNLGVTRYGTNQKNQRVASIAVAQLPEPILRKKSTVKGEPTRLARFRVGTNLAHELVSHAGLSLLMGKQLHHLRPPRRDPLTMFDNLVIHPAWNENHPNPNQQVDMLEELYR